jgi:hypothetical protein
MEKIKKVIKETMKIPYSNDDIYNKLNKRVKIITYSDLSNYNNLDDAMGKYEALVILIEIRKRFGHWICLFKRNNIIEVFDSYGFIPDDQLEFVDKQFRKNNNMYYPQLSKLLLNSNYDIEYNHYQLQKMSDDINTCGRWVVQRLLLKHLSLEEFYKLFKSDNTITSDELITYISLIK